MIDKNTILLYKILSDDCAGNVYCSRQEGGENGKYDPSLEYCECTI